MTLVSVLLLYLITAAVMYVLHLTALDIYDQANFNYFDYHIAGKLKGAICKKWPTVEFILQKSQESPHCC